jgi:hypothetical protein
MMFTNRYVTCIKVKGKVLRENQSTVTVPFGSEYSILLKNLNSVRALAKISIDGDDVTDGTKLILEPNQDFEIERFIRNGNFGEGNRFKFIERTESIEKHRGIKAEDGLVRVEFWKEKEYAAPPELYPNIDKWPTQDRRRRRKDDPWYPRPMWKSSILRSSSTSERKIGAPSRRSTSGIRGQSVNNSCFNETSFNASVNDIGITAPGSVSDQRFVSGAWFATESQSHVIVIHLRGEVADRRVSKPVTVQRKLSCVSCGLSNKSSSQFCSRCGTGLELVG